MKYHNKILLMMSLLTIASVMLGDLYSFHLSDSWYPSSAKRLKRSLLELAKNASAYHFDPIDSKKIQAIIVPHAAYKYSGTVASSVYQNIKPGTFNRVIILAPSHHDQFAGIALPGKNYDGYKSPLGRIALDVMVLKKLQKKSSLFFCSHSAHEMEHAVEVQIPFIQKYCGRDCKIVPLVVGSLSIEEAGIVADALKDGMNSKTLLVISSDFVHYGKSFNYTPFKTDIKQHIDLIDQALVEKICAGNAQDFANFLDIEQVPLCGRNPLLILLQMMQKKYINETQCHLLGHDVCASEQEDVQNCVSYVGMIIAQ